MPERPKSEYVRIRRTNMERIVAIAKTLEHMEPVDGLPTLAEGYAMALGRAGAMGFQILTLAESVLEKKGK